MNVTGILHLSHNIDMLIFCIAGMYLRVFVEP